MKENALFKQKLKNLYFQIKKKCQKFQVKKGRFSTILKVGFLVVVFLGGVALGSVITIKSYYFKTKIEKISHDIKEYFWPQSTQTFEKLNIQQQQQQVYQPQTSQEEKVIEVVKKATPAVVSIIIVKEMPVYKEYYEDPFKEFRDFFGDNFPFFEFRIPRYKKEGTQKKKIGGGTGFIISPDGLILTNKHVVLDKDAEYKVITNNGERYSAEVLARDPFQDLAILKIKQNEKILKKKFPTLTLGDSSTLEIGQTVIAIGNALGEFRNTVSVGVISGLGRRITASGGGLIETLEDVIQTDAAINRGNSGGPLLNLKGEVIGVNVAVAEGAQGIGFAIPVNKVKRSVSQVKTLGKIVYPFLGVRYVLITPELQEELDLPVDYGALIVRGDKGESAVVEGSAADKAGLRENDIILKVDNQKITPENSLSELIQRHAPNDQITLEVLRGKERLIKKVILGEKSSE